MRRMDRAGRCMDGCFRNRLIADLWISNLTSRLWSARVSKSPERKCSLRVPVQPVARPVPKEGADPSRPNHTGTAHPAEAAVTRHRIGMLTPPRVAGRQGAIDTATISWQKISYTYP